MGDQYGRLATRVGFVSRFENDNLQIVVGISRDLRREQLGSRP